MISIYADGASFPDIIAAKKNPLIRGFTTNPSIMKAAGIVHYERFVKKVLEIIGDLPISFEVFSDEWDEMERQARKIASWGKNVNVKIPVTNTKGQSAVPLIRKLSDSGVVCNVTAVFTIEQVQEVAAVMNDGIISIFAGRVADTGINPMPLMFDAVMGCMGKQGIKILWASPREVLNIYQAEECGCQIITVTADLLKKYKSCKGKNLNRFSLETVTMFYDDAQKAGYEL